MKHLTLPLWPTSLAATACLAFTLAAPAAFAAQPEAGATTTDARIDAVWQGGRGKDSRKWPDATPLFDARLSNAQFKPGSWAWSNDVLVARGGGDLWTQADYGDFTLQAEFQCAEQSNSGIFLRCSDTKEWLHHAIEVQIQQHDAGENKRHNVGAIFDCKAPSKRVEIKPGEWYRMIVTARGPELTVTIQDLAEGRTDTVTKMNLDEWKEAGKNPDGTPNKFKTAYKDMARTGKIGLQYHGTPIAFRNLWIERQ